jgi:WD40 repeat protein/serine/threonine protein kinase
MDDPSITNPAYRSLTDQQLAEIDELCDRFDQELMDGQSPRIEHFLAKASEPDRDGLLAELLAIELEYRTQRGDAPATDEYLRRFPQQACAVASALAGLTATHLPDQGTIHTPASIPPVLANFRLIEVIGRGGMGVVWLAEQDKPVKRRVALKLIKSNWTAKDVIARFESEKQALAMMDHPNIARVLDAGNTSDDRPFFVMELVEGIPFSQYCDDNKLSVNDRLKLFVPVCKAVQHAHQKGIIHRDLKPSNVLVAVIDGEAIPKVIDFGLAKAVAPDMRLRDRTMQTEYGKIIGTVQYMSPEQAGLQGVDGQDIDTQTDVYSLGVMLYELLTGSTPLDRETLKRNSIVKVLELVRDVEPIRPSLRLSSSSSSLNSEIGDRRRVEPSRLKQLLRKELDWVVMRALEKDRSRRYQTANDLAQDLSNYLTGEAVTARPPSTWYQVQKFSHRNRGLVSALVAIGFVLILGIAGTGYGLFRANEKTRLADDKTREAIDERGKSATAERQAVAEARNARNAEVRAKFQLAIARWDAGRALEARTLLHQIPEEYRDNFEWHYCNRRFQGSDITCYGHTNDVYAVAFTPDGKQMVSVDGDGKIKRWDSTTGTELASIGTHEGRVLALAVNADGTCLATAGEDQTVVLWDAKSGDILHTCRGHTGSINGVAFSPMGDRIATASDDKTIKLWDAESGKEIQTIDGHSAAVKGVAYSPDGEQLASVGGDRLIRIWDARSGEPITSLKQHNIEIHSVAFSPDGTRLIASSYGYVSLWDTQSWKFIRQTGTHDGLVRGVSFSPDGSLFATAGDDSKIKLWDANSGAIIKTLAGHARSVSGVAFSPDSSRLVSGSKDRTVRIWDSSGKDRTARVEDQGTDNAITLLGHSGQIYGVAFSSDGTLLASCGQYGSIILRNARTNEVLSTLKSHGGAPVNELSFSPDGTQFASAGDDSTVRLWNTLTGQEMAVLKGHHEWVRGIAFSPDGTQIASAGRDGTVKLWNAKTYDETATLNGHRGDVYCVAFSPDGTRLASGSFDQTVKLWDSFTGKEIRTFRGHTGRVRALAFDPKGERIVSGGYDTKVRVWDAGSGEQLATAHVRSGAVFGIAFSSDGKRIAVGHGDAAAHLFDASTGHEVLPLFLGNSGAARITFSPNVRRLAVAAIGIGRLRVFDAPQNHEATFLGGHTDTVTRVTFSPDGSRLYSESANEKLVWDVAKRETIPDAVWEPAEKPIFTSPDQRWFVTLESKNVVLVDLHYKDAPDEKAWRSSKAMFDPFWHQERATAATKSDKWCEAVFHYAWLLKHDSTQGSFSDGLQSSLEELNSLFGPQKGKQLLLRFSR